MDPKEEERKFILECIQLYRNLPALWDVNSKDYTNRLIKQEQYDHLLLKYRERYPQAHKSDLVKKFNSLRTNFRKQLKRIKEAQKAGIGSDILEPTLWYYEEMLFLENLETRYRSKSPLAYSKSNEKKELEIETVWCDDLADIIEKENNNVVDIAPRKKLKINNDQANSVSVAYQKLQPVSENQLLGLSWALELENMPRSQQLLAKKAINDILFEGQMGTLHRNSVKINENPTFITTSTTFDADPSIILDHIKSEP